MSVIRVSQVAQKNGSGILQKFSIAIGAFVILFGVSSIGSSAEAAVHHYYPKMHSKLSFSGHHHHYRLRSATRGIRRRLAYARRKHLAYAHRKHWGRHLAYRTYRHHSFRQRYGWVSPAHVAHYPRITPRQAERAGEYQRGAFYTGQGGQAPASNILSTARRYLGLGNVTGSHRPWCADFVNMVLRKTGHETSGSGMVQSMLHVGHRVSSPRPGDLVVMRGHVTIFAGYGPRGFVGLGGNQHHRVAMSNFPMRSVVAFVRP